MKTHKFIRQIHREPHVGGRKCYAINDPWDAVSFVSEEGIRECFGSHLCEPGETVEVEITVKVLRKVAAFVPGQHFREKS